MAGGEGKRGSSGKAFVVAGMVVAAPLLTVVVVLLCLVILVVAILQSDYGLGTRCVTGSSSWARVFAAEPRGRPGLRLFVVRVGGVAPCGFRRGVEPVQH